MICNRCGNYHGWFREASPAHNGIHYGCLCEACRFRLYECAEWERERLEMVPKHSE